MKKSTKKSLTALAAVPVAAALLAGCSFGGKVPSAIDDHPYEMPPRTYSTETEISDTIAFAGGIEAPDLTNSPDAYISSVSSNYDGSTIIIIENVAYTDYLEYAQDVMGGEEEPVSSMSDASYEVAFVDEEYEPDFSTMGIMYSSGAEAAVPAEFKLLSSMAAVNENLYIKFVMDPAKMYNAVLDQILATPGDYDGTGLERYPTEEEAKAALTELGITETSLGMVMEMAVRGEDFAVGVYTEGYSMVAAKVGEYLYGTEKGEERYVYENETSTALAQIWYKEAYTDELADSILSESMGSMGDMYSQYTLEELQEMFSATGYEFVDGKVYYYEEFYEEESESFIKYYFNNDELIYFASEDVDGLYYEFYISNTIPERMFRTECPTGYLDYTDLN